MTTRPFGSLLLAAATALSLTACGASLDAQTYQERNSAESTDEAVGFLAIRNLAVLPPPDGRYAQGDDALASITVVNEGTEADRLVEVTTPAAREVVTIAGTAEGDLIAPPLGSTGGFVTLELRGLTRELRPAEYIEMTLRFERNGSITTLVPIMTTGEANRPIYTGERFEGGEEPALQAPTGGKEGERSLTGAEEGREAPSTQGQGEVGEELGG